MGLSLSNVFAFLVVTVYGGVVVLSTCGVITVGGILSLEGGVVGWTWIPIFASVYAYFTMMFTVGFLLLGEELPFSPHWRVDGPEKRSQFEFDETDMDLGWPDNLQRFTLNGIGTRLSHLISRIDANHDLLNVKETPSQNSEGGGAGGGGRGGTGSVHFGIENNTPSKNEKILM